MLFCRSRCRGCLSSLLVTLRSNYADGNENVEKTIGFILSRTTTLHVHHAFCTFLCKFLHDYDAFMDYVNKHRRNFISFPELGYGPWEFNSWRVGYIWQSKWVEKSDVLVAVKSLNLKVFITVKPVLSGHPRECCSVRLIQGVRLIQVLIDNVIWGVKCHSNEQWKRLQYSQRLWRYTFALISLSKLTNWS